MSLIHWLALIPLIQNRWTLVALVVVLAYDYLRRRHREPK